eukprot:477186_1
MEQQKPTCLTCGTSFSSTSNYNQHLLTHKRVRRKPFKCVDPCDYATDRKNNLKKHQDICPYSGNNEPGQYSCPTCVYTTNDKSNLKKHRKKHEPIVECPKCHKLFSQTYIGRHGKKCGENRGPKKLSNMLSEDAKNHIREKCQNKELSDKQFMAVTRTAARKFKTPQTPTVIKKLQKHRNSTNKRQHRSALKTLKNALNVTTRRQNIKHRYSQPLSREVYVNSSEMHQIRYMEYNELIGTYDEAKQNVFNEIMIYKTNNPNKPKPKSIKRGKTVTRNICRNKTKYVKATAKVTKQREEQKKLKKKKTTNNNNNNNNEYESESEYESETEYEYESGSDYESEIEYEVTNEDLGCCSKVEKKGRAALIECSFCSRFFHYGKNGCIKISKKALKQEDWLCEECDPCYEIQ